MNVKVVTSRYPDKNSPYNHMFVHTRCLEIINQGINVEVYIPSSKTESFTYEGVKVYKLPSNVIISCIKKGDIIYIHLLNIYPFSKSNGWPIYNFILKNNLIYAMYIHGFEAQRYSSRMYEFNFTIREILRWLKKDLLVFPKFKYFVNKTKDQGLFIFPSKWMKSEMEKNLNCKINEYHIIPNGIDTKFFIFQNQSEYRFKMLTIRSLSSKVYDVEKTIEVMSHLPEQFTLDIYGEGVYLKKYQKMIEKKRLGNRVKIISTFVEKEEMRNLFRNYGVFISTTKMDSQGVTIMEAMAAGLLAVNTDNSSKREFFCDMKTSVLAKSTKSIAEKINHICSDLNLYNKITLEGSKSIKKLNITITIKNEIKVIKQFREKKNNEF